MTTGLLRSLSLWQVTFSGVGVILGAGVYALVGPAAAQAGNALWAAFVLAGIAAGLTAYSYARLAPLRPRNSAEFQYTSVAFGPRVGFVAGWLMLAADLLAAAAVALGFGGYLEHLTGLRLIPSALLLLVVAACVLYTGIAQSVGVVIAFTLVEAAGLVFIIAIGVPSLGSVNYLETAAGFGGLGSAAALVVFAYLGFDELGNLAEEMRTPERDLPRAFFFSMAVAIIIYVLVAIATVSVAGWETLSASSAPLAFVAGRVLGGSADLALSYIALAATANTVLLLLISGSRSLYGLGAAQALPPILGRVDRRGIPRVATTIALVIVGLLLLVEDIAQVASLTNAAVLGSFMLVNASLLVISIRKQRDLQFSPRASDRVVPAMAIGCCLLLLFYTGWLSVLIGMALAGLGWALGRRAHRGD